LRQSQSAAAQPLSLRAPAVDVLFRPEQKDGFSGENHVHTAPSGNGDVNHAFLPNQRACLYPVERG